MELKTDARGVAITEDPQAACQFLQDDIKNYSPLQRALFRTLPFLLPYPSHQKRIESIASSYGFSFEYAPEPTQPPLDRATTYSVVWEYARQLTAHYRKQIRECFKHLTRGNAAN